MEDVLSGAEGRQMSAPCLPEEGGRFSFATRDLYTSLDNEQPTTLSLALFLAQYPLFVRVIATVTCVTVKEVKRSEQTTKSLVGLHNKGTTVEHVWEWTLLVSNKDLRRSGELSLWLSHWCENLFYGSS
ncbi:hypothetical protein J6590_098405 [Homalodisca vitripennis]|nr:hypothetical protein J6590_098405 [Homalodisca vitripennis]